jgi:hypothetical protein
MTVMTPFFDLVRQDYDAVYAHALMSGTYVEEPRCPSCKLASRKRVSPLVVEWDWGSDVIADFTWPAGLTELVVTDRVKTCFVSNGFTGLAFEPIQMVQRPGLAQPVKKSNRRRRVWLPYSGPPLWNLVVSSWCDLDVASSSRSVVPECGTCGRQRMIVHDSTAPLVVKPESWKGTAFFSIREMGKLILVCEEVKQTIEEEAFTNVKMKARG